MLRAVSNTELLSPKSAVVFQLHLRLMLKHGPHSLMAASLRQSMVKCLCQGKINTSC